ncbi:MAG: SRPBCC family protein [Deltaproteobacteria bacterium]|nr:SRPBCC family protein [Deltaproteobacteria bacterium]
MARFHFEAEAHTVVARERGLVWSWMSKLPDSLRAFPLINDAIEIVPDERYELVLGPFGIKDLAMEVRAEMDVTKRAPAELVFESVPGTGNTDMRVTLLLDAAGASRTRVTVKLWVSPRAEVPRLMPVGMVAKAARATATIGLEQALKKARRTLEAKTAAS